MMERALDAAPAGPGTSQGANMQWLIRKTVCLLLGHWPMFWRKRASAATVWHGVGWRCRRCGWSRCRIRWAYDADDEEARVQALRLQHTLEQTEGGLGPEETLTWETW